MENTATQPGRRDVILKEWAESGIIKEIVDNVGKKYLQQQHNLDDLAQDLFIALSKKDDDFLEEMNKEKKGKKQIMYWLSRAAVNACFSNRSSYYIRYRKFSERTQEINYEN